MAFKQTQAAGDNVTQGQIGGLDNKYKQWKALKDEASLLEERLAELRDGMMTDIQSVSDDRDETGSYWRVLADGTQIKCERRVTTTLKPVEEVRAILEGLEQAARTKIMTSDQLSEAELSELEDRTTLTVAIARRTEEYVDQDYLYERLQEESITEEEIKSLFNEKVTWYFKPQKD